MPGVVEILPNGPLPQWLRKAPRRCDDPVTAARSLRALIDAHADETERLDYLPEAVVRAVAGAGLYALLVPKIFGGSEPHPVQLLDALAELSYADGSTGWAVMANNFFTGAMYSNGSEELNQVAFNSDTGYIGAGQISALGRADKVDGGYTISGSFHFGSGSREASWFLGTVVEYVDGQPVIGPNGGPVVKFTYTTRGHQVVLKKNWDVMWLAATASYDFEFPQHFVPASYVGAPIKRSGTPSASASPPSATAKPNCSPVCVPRI